MRGIHKGTLAGILAATALLASAAPAAAAPPYVASGMGAGGTCSVAMPCAFSEALAQANPGELVQLKDDSPFMLAVSLQIQGEIVEALVPGTRPEFVSTNGSGLSIFQNGQLRDVKLSISGMGGGDIAFSFQDGGLAERIEVIAEATLAGGTGALVKEGGLLRDSVVWAKSPSGAALRAGSDPGTFQNVTAVASGAGSVALLADSAYGLPQAATVRNSILLGATDIVLSGGLAPPMDIVINIDHSNFDTVMGEAPNQVVNRGPGNQSTIPNMPGIIGGDFAPAPGSVTTDAGALSPTLGPLDFNRGARVVNAKGLCDALPDIGAHEIQAAVPAPASCTPLAPAAAAALTPVAAVTKKCKKGRKLVRKKGKLKCKRKKKKKR